MYNAPRAATVRAKTDCVLFSLDRETFNHIVKTSSIQKRERYEKFLSRLEILEDLYVYELGQLCDVLQSEVFTDGAAVVRQGEKGEKLYFIERGEARAYIKGADGKDQLVYEFQKNNYFGELALLRDEPRAATIIAKGDLSVCSVDRSTFKRLLGPLDKVLMRNAKRYEKYFKN